MKVIILYLAFLLCLLVCVPLGLNSCIHDDRELIKNEISVYNHTEKKIMNMDLEEYIISVVAAEMPADFSLEALKAQAVAARTYALRKFGEGYDEHYGADICTDFSHCQAFAENEQMKKNWGKNYDKKYNKIKDAVNLTAGEVLMYDGDFAITVFHSCSNGITEKASDVWGGDIPYLINVKSEGDKNKKDYISYAEFSYSEFKNKLTEFLQKDLPDNDIPIGDIESTSGENVGKICLFGENLKGTDVRKIFSLKSSAFELDFENNKFKFTVFGSGHGVGMSQYGADKMGEDGNSYRKILEHYYPNTEIELNK